MTLLVPFWLISIIFIGIISAIILFFVLLQKKTYEKNQLDHSMKTLQDQQKKDALVLSKQEYIIQNLRQEKEQFLLLQQKFEHDRSHFFKELIEKTMMLETARNQFIKEQEKNENEAKKRQEQEQENQSRVWNDHEKNVIASIKKICHRSESFFITYDNTKLPSFWDSSIKPDCLVCFADRYIVFDAKKSKNTKTYIDQQVRITVEKYECIDSIESVIFFVIPENEINTLEKTIYLEKQYTIVIIPPSALSAVMILLKQLEAMQTISAFDPKERKSIVQLLLQYQTHTSLQNSLQLLLSEKSISIIEQTKTLPLSLQNELIVASDHIGPLLPSIHQIKKMVQNTDLQKEKIQLLQKKFDEKVFL